ncbi:YihA family ribosome biogenesis GTP-binding protein [Helicobacter monodelphidis]|uniref:ribosome biogenesis GTP-binding protein YihA/YsxC n=1 Tax=Helicobacter sp. 15-1451 TaxID=2004995 RepID=UPI000DCDA4DF|nr:ribosome biogenesis GTP-binding protein YihA/YsxC [Helicobacter sp. 15-1451]RAX58875.1 YihA family ribosome biogenesis GTP-binding protein [Helicobacter sp. 15-1451]
MESIFKEGAISILQTHFITSTPTIHKAPPNSISEIVFLGRSNVGKSTLINLLLGQKGLAKSSSTPGKTQLINYFKTKWNVNNEIVEFYFVDLPGFGYAKVSKAIKEQWIKNLKEFLQKRDSIKLFLQLIDSRHPALDIDKQASTFLQKLLRNDQKVIQIFTKCDKLNKNDFRQLQCKFPESLFTHSKMTKNEVQAILQNIYIHTLGIQGGIYASS